MFENLRKDIGQRMWTALGPYLARAQAATAPYLNRLRARYNKLEPRERILVKVAGALLAIFFAYNLIYLPIQGVRTGIDQRIAARQHELTEVRSMVRTYLRLKSAVAAAHQRTIPNGKNFSLFSVVEKTLSDHVGRDKVGSITPGTDKKLSPTLTEYRVDLQLNNLSLSQVVDALYGLTTVSVPITVSNLRIRRRFQDPHSYDVNLTCVAVGKNS